MAGPAIAEDDQSFAFFLALLKRCADRADSKAIPIFSDCLELQDILVPSGRIVIIPETMQDGIIPESAKAADSVWNPGFTERLSNDISLYSDLRLAAYLGTAAVQQDIHHKA